MDNVKGKTGFGWIELADVEANPTDTDTSRGALAVVGTDLKFWNKSAWVTVKEATSSHVVKYAGEITMANSATETVATVTGVAETDIVLVTWKVNGDSRTVVSAVPTEDTITITTSGNTSDTDKLFYQVLRAN